VFEELNISMYDNKSVVGQEEFDLKEIIAKPIELTYLN
jgi:hypothetical protein